MAYRLKPDKSFEHEVRRIGIEQIDRAHQCLAAGSKDGTSIHETRKALKRLRALLRLVKPGLKSHDYERENERYRDIARLLSAARDNHVLMETVDKFATASAGRTKAAFTAAKHRLASSDGGQQADHSDAIQHAIEELAAGREAMADLEIKESDFKAAIEGMARTYRQAARAFERAYETLDAEALHDWRKYVQHHWRHMSLMLAAWPEMAQARVAAAKRISAMLGEDHDITVMLEQLKTKANAADVKGGRASRGKAGLSDNQRKLTQACAIERQAELRAACKTLGLRLFAEPPEAFADRMRHYWASAAAEDESPAV